jgi:hypothetical protein
MHINLWAVLVAALANFIIGFLMHGPIAGKMWMRLANIVPTGKEKFSDMYGQMFSNFVANFVFAFVLGQMIAWNGIMSASTGAFFAFWVWLGFLVTSSSMDVIWMKQSWKLWMFENFSSLLCVLAMGAILASW